MLLLQEIGSLGNRNISKEIIEKVFDEIKYIQTLDLSGGEVFLGYEQLKTLLETANQKGTTIESSKFSLYILFMLLS